MFRKKELFSLSEEHNSNYVATICKIDSLEPIEGADNLLKTIINGYNIVVTKDYKVGDIVVYIPIETVISNTFLSKFNLFSDYELNNNRSDIENLRELRENAREA